MPDNQEQLVLDDVTGRMIPPPPPSPWGPLTMAKEMLKEPDFARAVQRRLESIEHADETNDVSITEAVRALRWLNQYYSVRDTSGEIDALNLTSAHKAALSRCTERNTLILVAAYLS
jgi:hypothetical protein